MIRNVSSSLNRLLGTLFSGTKIKFHDHSRTLKIFSLDISWPMQPWHEITILCKLFHMENPYNHWQTVRFNQVCGAMLANAPTEIAQDHVKTTNWWNSPTDLSLARSGKYIVCFELNVYIARTYFRFCSTDRPKSVQLLFVALISPVSI